MASKFAVSATCLVALVVLVFVQESLADVKQKTYLIKGRKVPTIVDAATQLRHFLSTNLTAHKRCQRHAILLNAYVNKKSTLTNFQIAEIGLLKQEEVDRRFNNIEIEALRSLYIGGVQAFLDAQIANGALVELYNCLSVGFRNRDAKARSFLNNEDVKRIIDQYESIASQSVNLLIEDKAKHPELKLDELDPTVRKSVSNWFGANKDVYMGLFEHAEREPERKAIAAGAVDPRAPQPESYGVESEQVPDVSEPEQVMDDSEFLSYVFGSIIATYESLPLETSLGDRCRAYSEVVEADQKDLIKENFVHDLIQRMAGKNQGPEVFMPEDSKRANFMFVVQTVDPTQGGAEAWSDMVDCVRQWQDEDQEAAQFMNSPELAQTFEQLIHAADTPSAEAGAEAGAYTNVDQSFEADKV